MPTPWFKLWPEKVLKPEFFMLSAPARSSFMIAFMLAHQTREKGYAMTVSDLGLMTGLLRPKQLLAVKELAVRGMIELDGEILRLHLFDEMQRPRSNAERQRAFKDRLDETLFGNAPGNVGTNGEANAESDDAVTKKNRSTDHLRTPFASQTPYSGDPDAKAPNRWNQAVREATEGLDGQDLAQLDPADRFTLARWHALEFANCARSEGRNASAARRIARGISDLTDRLNRQRWDLTVGEYRRAARRLWERGGKSPWWSPLDVLAELAEAPR